MKNEETHQLIVTKEKEGERIDKFLATHPLVYSRSRAAKLIDLLKVTVNSKPTKASYLVESDDLIEITIPSETNDEIEPYDLKLNIVFEDPYVIVVDKPAGLVVHPGAGHKNDTLVNALVSHTKDLSMGFNENRPGIVHRIDKETSGLLVIAKSDFSHEKLSQQFKEKSIHRIYLALVHGQMKPESGQIKTKLRRHPTQRKKFSSQDEGKTAITNYETLFRAEQISLVRLKLETGRTHQIRVHLSEQGNPIVGDSLYGSSKRDLGLKNKSLKNEVLVLKRFALHASELGFIHPHTSQELKFRSKWPEDLQKLASELSIKMDLF